MIVTSELMVQLRKLAKDYCGGYKHVLEVQTWDRGNGPEVDILEFSEEDCDNSSIGHFDLKEGAEIPADVGQLDISVWGVEFKAAPGEVLTEADMTKLGYFFVTLKDGKIVEDWQ